ncbi:hypothetical protein EW146_g8860 [Bondarzewia mesenterica]|uniref:Uncharacterized protein n=1 Tax=Bondarzewia mesenterica TaxID=1095465 RepID=A0A4S4LAZ3_9AGAM|nr:hypothetical protein EW146_g8860 [Bondarzewia mesenterica]
MLSFSNRTPLSMVQNMALTQDHASWSSSLATFPQPRINLEAELLVEGRRFHLHLSRSSQSLRICALDDGLAIRLEKTLRPTESDCLEAFGFDKTDAAMAQFAKMDATLRRRLLRERAARLSALPGVPSDTIFASYKGRESRKLGVDVSKTRLSPQIMKAQREKRRKEAADATSWTDSSSVHETLQVSQTEHLPRKSSVAIAQTSDRTREDEILHQGWGSKKLRNAVGGVTAELDVDSMLAVEDEEDQADIEPDHSSNANSDVGAYEVCPASVKRLWSNSRWRCQRGLAMV